MTDWSVASGVQVPQQNFLQMLGTAAQIQNARNQNELFKQKFAAQKAMGPLAQQAIDPTTGELNYEKMLGLMATNPDTAFLAPEFANTITQRLNTQSEIEKRNLDIAKERASMTSQALGALAALGDKVTVEDVVKESTRLINAGMDPKTITAQLASIPQEPGRLPEWIQRKALQAASADKMLEAVIGQTQTIDHGGATSVLNVRPLTGEASVLASAPKTLTPAEANALVPGASSTGAPTMTPRNLLAPTNVGEVPPVTVGARGTTRVIPGSPSTMTSAGLPSDVSGTAAAGVSTPGATVTGPDAARAQYLKGEGPIAKYETELNTRIQAGTQSMLKLDQIRELMEIGRTGGGASVRSRVAELAQAVGVPEKYVDDIAGGNLAANQAINKYLVQQATDIGRQAVGGVLRNQQEFDAFQKANQNLDTDPRAGEKLQNFVTKMYELDRAEQDAFNEYKSDPTRDLTKFENWWAKQLQRSGAVKPEYSVGRAKGTERSVPLGRPQRPSLQSIFGGP